MSLIILFLISINSLKKNQKKKMKIQVSKIDHSLSCEIILFGHIYLFIYLKDKIQFTIPHSMEALRMRCTLLAIKIPVAEIQPFPNRWESLVSAYSPGSVTTVLAGKYLMPQKASVHEAHLASWAAGNHLHHKLASRWSTVV